MPQMEILALEEFALPALALNALIMTIAVRRNIAAAAHACLLPAQATLQDAIHFWIALMVRLLTVQMNALAVHLMVLFVFALLIVTVVLVISAMLQIIACAAIAPLAQTP